jgi:hypothetical protein
MPSSRFIMIEWLCDVFVLSLRARRVDSGSGGGPRQVRAAGTRQGKAQVTQARSVDTR